MTTANNDDDVLAATLIQIADPAERTTGLDTREATHHHDVATRLDAITATLGHHATVIKTVDSLDRHVTAITDRLTQLIEAASPDSPAYQPQPAPRWWRMSGTEQEPATGRLRAWVEHVYRPAYGHLAGAAR
jgi:hypothetical protein